MADAIWFLPFNRERTIEVLDLFLENRLTLQIKLSIISTTDITTGFP